MRVEFRESEICARCAVVETGELDALYLLSCHCLFAQICLHAEFSHLSLEHISFPSEQMFLCNTFPKELLSAWK